MNYLVTGSAGLVGTQVVKDLLKLNHRVYSCYNDTKPQSGIPTKLDLTNQDDIKQVLNKTQPDRIIHLAAITNVDLCETEQDMAMKINTNSTKTLANEAAKLGAFYLGLV